MSETIVHRRASVTTRLRAGFPPRQVPITLAIAAAACLFVTGCSPGADYPTIFPAVHDMPPPRADTPMDPDQVQQATEDLITQRNHLEAQGSGPGKDSSNPSTTGTNQPAAKKQSPAVGSTNSAASGQAQGANPDGTLTAGAETK